MKITHVVAHPLRAPIADEFSYSQGYYGAREAVLVEPRTDEGPALTGWGQCSGAPEAVPALLARQYAPRLVGQDPRRWRCCGTTWGASAAGTTGSSAGLEIALLDLAGKGLGLPGHGLLGGAFRERVQVYATGVDPEALERFRVRD